MQFKLNNVRIAFPNLYEPRAVKNSDKPRYSACFLIEPNDPQIAKLKGAILQVAKDKWGNKHEQVLKSLKAQDRLCLHDGDTKAKYAGFEGMMFVSAARQLRDGAPSVFDQNLQPLTMASGKPYSGCYVNVSIDIWAQGGESGHGERINAALRGVQFASDGERLSGGGTASEDEFEAIPTAEGDAGGLAENADSIF